MGAIWLAMHEFPWGYFVVWRDFKGITMDIFAFIFWHSR